MCYGADMENTDIMHTVAKSPMEKELVQSGRYELFKAVLDVYNYALDMNEKALQPILNKDPNPALVQDAGLGLYVVIDVSPIYLCMPWGRLDIDSGSDSMVLSRWITDSFFKKFTLSLESHEAEQEYKRHNVKVDPSASVVFYGVSPNGLFEIPEKDLERYRGTSTLITSNVPGNFSCYRIKAIDGKPLPEQKERPGEKGRSIQAISYEWDLLNIMYSKEKQAKFQQELLRARRIFRDQKYGEEY